MTIYNKASERKEMRKSKSESVKEPQKKRKPRRIARDREFHRDIMGLIDDLVLGKPGIYETLMRNLRKAHYKGLIDRETMEYYKSLADKKLERQRESKEKAQETEAEIETSTLLGYPEERKKPREKLVPEEEMEAEARPFDEEKKKSGWKKFTLFMRSPLGRVSAFIILAVFLILYLTKTSMQDVANSPLIIVLVVLVIFIILGRGGKTRTHDTDRWF